MKKEKGANIMWHFSALDQKLGYSDGRKINAGETLTVPSISMCNYGLHASTRIIDALKYAPALYVWNVELSGQIEHGGDKSVATERTALWGYNATEVIRQFARKVALDAVETYWNAKDLGPFPEVVLYFLRTGEAAEAAARAALAAAEAEAAAAAAAAAEAAAAAAAAAEAAAAAAAAAGAAEAGAAGAGAAGAGAAARAAARAAQNELLEKMILSSRPVNQK